MSNVTTTPRPNGHALTFISAKISDEHLQRGAALYVRQSSFTQLREHQESTARQYALKHRLVTLGWPNERVTVIDDDLGISGSGNANRPGFTRLLKLITDQQVGIVLGLEMSRLARNSKDWHDLFEVCAIFRTLIADEDGVFDPQDPNDRLVLGLKGIIAELELHTMKVRLERGRMNKAQRGELFHDVPVGYVVGERGLPQLDPDESARHAMKMFFDLFLQVGSSHGLFLYLSRHQIKLPFRANTRDLAGRIDWRVPAVSTVYELLMHPLYTGAYGYGRRKNYRRKGGKRQGNKYLPVDQWKVLIKDLHPSYITWAQFEQNQQRLRENDNIPDRSGPVRGGNGLLPGIIVCAHCGRRMSPSYPTDTHAIYRCGRHNTVGNAKPCNNSIRCATLDDFVASKLLETLSPACVSLSQRVIEDEQTRRQELETLHAHRVEQARYAVDVAERRYKHTDPANRLVAGRLEQEWETSLAELDLATTELDQVRHNRPVQLSDTERADLRQTCAAIVELWRERATVEDRKRIVRLLIERVTVEVHNNTERVSVRLHWSGGYESTHEITRTVMEFRQMETFGDLIDRLLELTVAGNTATEVAAILKLEGFRSPRSNNSISAMMVHKLLTEQPRCREQLTNPKLEPNHWRSEELANKLGIPDKQLKHWVTRGWATATQRPHGRVWIIYADDQELTRLQALACRQKGQGRSPPPENLRTPMPITRKKH